MKPITEKELKKVVAHCRRYAKSLQYVMYERTGKYFHDNAGNPVQYVYLCPICLKNKAAILNIEDFRSDDEFTIDHFPPQSVGGKGKILVCKTCNNTAGKEYDYAIKEWIQEQAFVQGVPGSKMPVNIQYENLTGQYKESLVSNGSPLNFNFDRFERYPQIQEWFTQILSGKAMTISLRTRSVQIELVYKALLKAAYLKAFSIWGYDFIYTDTGIHLRDVFHKNAPHPLTNFGVFFHLDKPFPPAGLCYVFQPENLQSFLMNFEIRDPDTGFTCGISVLIPGDYLDDWNRLKHYQPLIEAEGIFRSGFIRLPEDMLTEKEYFPYTKTWHGRSGFRIAGIHDQPART